MARDIALQHNVPIGGTEKNKWKEAGRRDKQITILLLHEQDFHRHRKFGNIFCSPVDSLGLTDLCRTEVSECMIF